MPSISPPTRWIGRGGGTPPHPLERYWRAALVVFFNYGVDTGTVWRSTPAHEPILWRHVIWDRKSPDREAKERSPWGWLFYRRVKTDKAFYRPMNRVVHAHIRSLMPEDLMRSRQSCEAGTASARAAGGGSQTLADAGDPTGTRGGPPTLRAIRPSGPATARRPGRPVPHIKPAGGGPVDLSGRMDRSETGIERINGSRSDPTGAATPARTSDEIVAQIANSSG